MTNTGLNIGFVEVGIFPYSEKSADYLYGLFGRDMVRVVEGIQASLMPAVSGLATDAMPGTGGIEPSIRYDDGQIYTGSSEITRLEEEKVLMLKQFNNPSDTPLSYPLQAGLIEEDILQRQSFTQTEPAGNTADLIADSILMDEAAITALGDINISGEASGNRTKPLQIAGLLVLGAGLLPAGIVLVKRRLIAGQK